MFIGKWRVQIFPFGWLVIGVLVLAALALIAWLALRVRGVRGSRDDERAQR